MADLPPNALTRRARLDQKLEEARRLAKGAGGGGDSGGRNRHKEELDAAVAETVDKERRRRLAEVYRPLDEQLAEIGRSARALREIAAEAEAAATAERAATGRTGTRTANRNRIG